MSNEVKRMNYYDGLFLKADDFILEQNYHLRLRRLHNRYLHSPGIVTGLQVKPGSGPKVIVTEGMALNRTLVDGEEVSQEILLYQDYELDLSKYKAGDNIYITIGYQEELEGKDEQKGDKELHIWERSIISHAAAVPANPDQNLVLARVTPKASNNGIIIDLSCISDKDVNGTILRTAAGMVGLSVETKKLTLSIDGEMTSLPYITGNKTGTQNGIQVNSPLTQFSGSLAVDGELTVKGAVTTVNTENLVVKDNLITINKYDPQATPKDINSGMEVFRGGTAKNAQIIWDEKTQHWKMGLDGNLADIAYGSPWDKLINGSSADSLHKHSILSTSSGTAALTVNDKGKIGIGTSVPFQALTVGDRKTADSQDVMLRVVGDGPGSWKGGGAFGHGNATVVLGELNKVASIGGHKADLSAWADLSINSAGGNVGIGTAAPGYKLDVNGSMRVTGSITPSAGNSENNGIMFPKDPGGGSGDAAWIRYYARSGESCTLEMGISNDGDDHIALMPSNGNVGIGTNTPGYKLDVNGGIRVKGQAIIDNSYIPAGVENLGLIRGTVNADGSIAGGKGFTVKRQTQGVYDVFFATSFSDTPTVAVTQIYRGNVSDLGGDTRDNAVVVGVNKGQVRLKVGEDDGKASDRMFGFIVMGPR
jgi:hypothetical protein